MYCVSFLYDFYKLDREVYIGGINRGFVLMLHLWMLLLLRRGDAPISVDAASAGYPRFQKSLSFICCGPVNMSKCLLCRCPCAPCVDTASIVTSCLLCAKSFWCTMLLVVC